ncbi:MAG TPA: DUF350 domain-containing protein [Verrucomicrobiae bacterium]|nr:DUF350 domain-containing protein [Verrucomicrobiae bacterium]
MNALLPHVDLAARSFVKIALLAEGQGLPVSSAAPHARPILDALWQLGLFGLAGMALAILGYKLFDLFTPGSLHREIVENKNVAAAIVGAAVILGVCLIVAATMVS